MTSLTSTAVVIAAYNEGLAIGEVVTDAAKVCPNIIVVDDGSSDETGSIALNAGAFVLRHEINLGQGAALQTGIRYACLQSFDFIVTFDADGQHQASDIPSLVNSLINSDADIAFGSRFLPGGEAIGIGAIKRLVLRAGVLFTALTSGLLLSDTHNGFRAIRREAAEKIRIRQNRMAHASEIVSLVARHRLRYVEVPVTIVYSAYSRSKGQRLSNAVSILAELFTGRLTR